jgi:hypothetical protein
MSAFRRCCDSPAQKSAPHIKGCVNHVDKPHVVVCENHYGREDGYSVEDIIGPFPDRNAAQQAADRLTAKNHYGMEYSVSSLSTKHWSDE